MLFGYPAKTALLMGSLAVAVVVLGAPNAAHAQACVAGDYHECPSDGALVLGDVSKSLPRNAFEANYTFDNRAAKILQYAACDGPSVVLDIDPNSKQPLYQFGSGPTGKPNMLEAWGRDALAKLAYAGDCGLTSATERYEKVDERLAQISVPSTLLLGTGVSANDSPGGVGRVGELDTGLKELIPIVYLYASKIPMSYSHILDILRQSFPNNTPTIPPFFLLDTQIPLLGSPAGAAAVPETENHTLLITSEQYLVNQLLRRNNSAVHDYLMSAMKGILANDFFEYNAKPYQSYALYAMENLEDFAADSDVRDAAQMVLDFAAAKFAVSSSLLRRSSPFRRRAAKDGNLFTGSDADAQLCRYYLYSGQLQVTNKGGTYVVGSGCAWAAREVIARYRPPNVILDLAIHKEVPYFQTFSSSSNYYATLFGSRANYGQPVKGPVEVYDNEGTFLIAAGGIPEPNGLPLLLPASGNVIVGWGDFFGFPSSKCNGPHNECYSTSFDDVGISLPTLLIPYDPPNDPTNLLGPQPIVDRTQLVRIEGTGYDDVNLCVAPGFACGKNPTMPSIIARCNSPYPVAPCVHFDAPWQFAILPSVPFRTYVAMLSTVVYHRLRQDIQGVPIVQVVPAPYQIGFFEAAGENKFRDFDAFQGAVKAANPAGGALIVERDGPDVSCFSPPGGSCLVSKGWTGHYRKTDGTELQFIIPIKTNPVFVTDSTNYTVQSSNSTLPPVDPSKWNQAHGPIQANHSDLVIITNPANGSSCRLDITNIHSPNRTCYSTVNYGLHSGFMIQSADGNLEMLVSQAGRLENYWRDLRNIISLPWQGDDVMSFSGASGGGSTTVNGATLLQSIEGNLELTAWLHQISGEAALGSGPRRVTTDYLVSSYRDPTTKKWSYPSQILVNGRLISGVTGTPAFIQSTEGTKGNFEIVVPEGGRLVNYWRDNDALGLPWHQGDDVMSFSGTSGIGSTTVKGVALLQSIEGNLEVVAWLHQTSEAVVLGSGSRGTTSDYLVSSYRDPTTKKWSYPSQILVNGKLISGVTGTPAFIQSTVGIKGNFEIVVPEGGRLVNYWRDNDAPGLPWHQGDDVMSFSGTSGIESTTVNGTALLQSIEGNLQVVAWLHKTSGEVVLGSGSRSAASDFLVSSYAHPITKKWSNPSEIMVNGVLILNVSGPK